MTLIITATGQRAEIEEVHDAGFYCTVQGHSRFLPSEAVTRPAPEPPNACPECGHRLHMAYERFVIYLECEKASCYYVTQAPSLF